jgi:hypothetical protein
MGIIFYYNVLVNYITLKRTQVGCGYGEEMICIENFLNSYDKKIFVHGIEKM